MRQIAFVLLFVAGCKSQPIKQGSLYVYELSYKEFSMATMRFEDELDVDTFYAETDTAAFDTAALNIYAQQEAIRVVKRIYEKNNAANKAKYFYKHIKDVAIYNKDRIDISVLLSDSIKAALLRKYKVEPFKE